MAFDANRLKLMFGFFILALLVGIAYRHENEVASKINNYYDKDELHTFLLMLMEGQFRKFRRTIEEQSNDLDQEQKTDEIQKEWETLPAVSNL
ncbi:hypothetical protein L5515_018568 [Caenorhabditis briggsae]|uniref:Uncharacterized protein n=1 Tax=Caenorhabditis briggsae TaxID=6238 RepID=A0AAE9FHF4_CAEBR|nr:hypothetical protein L5515_018568 [Caenorhabditis briggsae]